MHHSVYADPVNYDLESSQFDPDNTILLDMIARANGPVLELGCGTGRVTIPLARQGIEIVGLEIVPGMLDHARSKAGDLPVQWVNDDVRFFQLQKHFALIFTYGQVFQHLITRAAQEEMLARVRDHLAPGGRFIIDIGYKRPLAMVDSGEEEIWYSYTDHQGREVQVAGRDRYDHIRQIWYQKMVRRWTEADGTQTARRVELVLRYFMPQEVETLLDYNGFSVLSRYGDWNGSPFREDSYLQIYVCTAQSAKPNQSDNG